MKRPRIVATTNTFDDFFSEISHDWEAKARRLQARRWRALKHATEEDLGHGSGRSTI